MSQSSSFHVIVISDNLPKQAKKDGKNCLMQIRNKVMRPSVCGLNLRGIYMSLSLQNWLHLSIIDRKSTVVKTHLHTKHTSDQRNLGLAVDRL